MTREPVTILLAEDDDGHASLVQRNLERAGFLNGIFRVNDGKELLACLEKQQSPEGTKLGDELIILMDVNMPRLGGVEALRQIKGNPATQKIPVIMLTTTDDPREVNRCYELGCNMYITKPVDYEGFTEAIRRLGSFLQVVKHPQSGWSS